MFCLLRCPRPAAVCQGSEGGRRQVCRAQDRIGAPVPPRRDRPVSATTPMPAPAADGCDAHADGADDAAENAERKKPRPVLSARLGAAGGQAAAHQVDGRAFTQWRAVGRRSRTSSISRITLSTAGLGACSYEARAHTCTHTNTHTHTHTHARAHAHHTNSLTHSLTHAPTHALTHSPQLAS